MAVSDPFGGPDPARVDAISQQIGNAFRAGFRPLAHHLIADATLPPSLVTASLAKAYATGLTATIVSAPSVDPHTLVADICAWLHAEVAKGAGG